MEREEFFRLKKVQNKKKKDMELQQQLLAAQMSELGLEGAGAQLDGPRNLLEEGSADQDLVI